ncbi:DUF4179 domain-containing protein [Fictibacillus aquaticus]|uniref:DUF4179 domain-containing protein n=1 Tax=Fictibacillus aquaticus TaxID=2021314 RepID=A0A235F5I6_9BACL|nr:DUF4179 domain-containing protein [Fictibacillus aquaticus]OYD56541.1 hypothetical protein CGZ90_16140 [Fictibacillus aquaticus]
MEKAWFDKEVEEIEVPQQDILKAISAGMQKGRLQKKQIVRKKLATRTGWITSSAAALLLAAGFVSTPVKTVLADVPFLGGIYDKFGSETGKELAQSGLVTKLNEEAVSNNVSLTVTSAYYDGTNVGITFTATGDGLVKEDIDRNGVWVSGFNFYLYEKGEQTENAGSSSGLKKTENGYEAAVEFEYREKELPEDFTLPITFTNIAGNEGMWKFNVPVKQLPIKTIASNASVKTKTDSLQLQSVSLAKASTIIDFTWSTAMVAGANDSVELKVLDDKGKQVNNRNGGVLSVQKIDGMQKKEMRTVLNKVNANAKYLMVYPEISRDEEDTLHKITAASFKVKSSRSPYSVSITGLKKDGNVLTLDYELTGLKASAFKKDILQNFAEMAKVVHKNDLAQKQEAAILSSKGIVLDKEKLRLQSRFVLAKGSSEKDYYVMIPFGILSMNSGPDKMDPIKIMLNQ